MSDPYKLIASVIFDSDLVTAEQRKHAKWFWSSGLTSNFYDAYMVENSFDYTADETLAQLSRFRLHFPGLVDKWVAATNLLAKGLLSDLVSEYNDHKHDVQS